MTKEILWNSDDYTKVMSEYGDHPLVTGNLTIQDELAKLDAITDLEHPDLLFLRSSIVQRVLYAVDNSEKFVKAS